MSPAFRTLDQLDAAGKTALVRCDFNVPMSDGAVADATRIERALDTIGELRDMGAKVVALSHFGRPKGRIESSMSLEPVARAFADALGAPVSFAEDCIGPAASMKVSAMKPGDVALLENLRFHEGEEKNDPTFAAALASMGDVYVNDAFSCSHRAHASVTGLAERLPAYAGRLMQRELEALEAALGAAERPAAALIGGAKVSSKLAVIGHILDKIDVLIIGGGMANTFLYAKGYEIGASLCEKDLAEKAREILAECEAKEVAVILPIDAAVAPRFEQGQIPEIKALDQIGRRDMILDIGPASAAACSVVLERAKTLLWNGPMGAFELENFDHGTNSVARSAAEFTDKGQLRSVAGGGDTVAALAHAGVLDRFSYVSTAGGAFLEWLEGKTLPGVAALAV